MISRCVPLFIYCPVMHADVVVVVPFQCAFWRIRHPCMYFLSPVGLLHAMKLGTGKNLLDCYNLFCSYRWQLAGRQLWLTDCRGRWLASVHVLAASCTDLSTAGTGGRTVTDSTPDFDSSAVTAISTAGGVSTPSTFTTSSVAVACR